MEKKRLILPIGIQTFEKLRETNCVYVDKTKYLVQLIDTGSIYFLSRPRRFGKSLTISTFDALFSGKKELFKGLYAEEFLNRPEFKPSPVIRLDMSAVATEAGIDIINSSIKHQILGIAQKLRVKVSENLSNSDIFRELIRNTAQKFKTNVVILIDEYDKPFTDFFDEPEMAEKIRTILRSFYSQIKANDEYIRFVFITGIAKFTKMGVFSTLNNLIDISPLEKYGEMCGYTEVEIVNCFPEYLEDTAQKFGIATEKLVERMRNYYDGFCFDTGGKHHLFNPFSTLLFFSHQEFFNFWFESATPSILAKYLKSQKLTIEQFRNFPVSRDDIFNSVEIEKAPPENYLFQTGYLSLRQGTIDDYALDYPNTEVLNSMSKLLVRNILPKESTNLQNLLFAALVFEDDKKLVEVINTLLASIPYDDFLGAAKQSIFVNKYVYSAHEWLYRSTILAFFRGCGIVVNAEMHTNLGRADLIVSHKNKTWIIEIKVAYKGQSAKEKAMEALQQIIDKNYAKPYPASICIGIAIDDTVRQITEYSIQNE